MCLLFFSLIALTAHEQMHHNYDTLLSSNVVCAFWTSTVIRCPLSHYYIMSSFIQYVQLLKHWENIHIYNIDDSCQALTCNHELFMLLSSRPFSDLKAFLHCSINYKQKKHCKSLLSHILHTPTTQDMICAHSTAHPCNLPIYIPNNSTTNVSHEGFRCPLSSPRLLDAPEL